MVILPWYHSNKEQGFKSNTVLVLVTETSIHCWIWDTGRKAIPVWYYNSYDCLYLFYTGNAFMVMQFYYKGSKEHVFFWSNTVLTSLQQRRVIPLWNYSNEHCLYSNTVLELPTETLIHCWIWNAGSKVIPFWNYYNNDCIIPFWYYYNNDE